MYFGMSHYLDPIAAVEQPRQDLIRYLLTAYPLRDPHLRFGLKQQLEQQRVVWQHPYLQGSQPYRPASSVRTLVDQGVLHSDLAKLFQPSDRALYEHQERAIKAVIAQQQNIVVATGTGSGKTECFLIPILDRLLKEGDRRVQSGVRVLILYPMNALVNDQVKRLRQLLCRQDTPRIKFGFYTSRTEKQQKGALESLAAEFKAYEPEELQKLLTAAEKTRLNLSTRQQLIQQAIAKTQQVQLLSREEIWESPPQILITNYSMLEHMLIRPVERGKIFEASADTFQMLVVDEAHTYNGSTGTEVSMLLERLKAAVGKEKTGQVRCIATSASLGDKSVDQNVITFAQELFGEPFTQVIRGDRVTATERLGQPYSLPPEMTDTEILGYLSILDLPAPDDPLTVWRDRLSGIVPAEIVKEAESQAEGDIHKFLMATLKRHPLVHRLIDLLSRRPQPWQQVVQSSQLWGVNLPLNLDGTVDDTDAKLALAHLLQLGTLARNNSDDLPLLPVRLHLLFRSLEGLYACINPECPGAVRDPNCSQLPRYGRLYLNSKTTCDDCHSPVLELGSCSQCGQAYTFTQLNNSGELQPLPRATARLRDNPRIYTLTSGNLDSITEEDDIGETESEPPSDSPKTLTILAQRDGWIGSPSPESFPPTVTGTGKFHLAWHRQKGDKNLDGCYLPKCAACGFRSIRAQAINRFVAYTDEPLEAMIDSLFELLPESKPSPESASKRKLLTFSDGRQDAAFFASDYQRNHTEKLYRQMLYSALQEVKDADGVASVNQVSHKLRDKFLNISIPHPDRNSQLNYLSYVPGDETQERQSKRDCQDRAESRAKEILLREFALPFARRSALESFGILACHVELEDERLIRSVADGFHISDTEAEIFLIGLLDIIRRTGIVSIDGASQYFPETGGVQGGRREMIDAQGRSKNYLFLEKSADEMKKYKDSPAFMPKWKKDGTVSKVQNRLGWYYFQIFGEGFPQKEDFVWLFEQLKSFGLLVNAQKGYHLNWNLLNIIETEQDWHQCDRCQQIFHVPGLSESLEPTLNIKGCPTFKCSGQLQPYQPEKIKQAANEHYLQYLIKNQPPLPLRSQEHTAQLGVGELEKRENRFRRGQINLLSCSTTLEMGVDIGELQAVVLRNFPPHVSNYQQRAGRAGRRTDGVAITLMYGQRRPHDRFYFEQPEQLIAGSNQIPKLDANNFQIQQRHIRAELLADFLKSHGVGAEEVKIADFFDLPQNYTVASTDFQPPATSLADKLREWLHSDEAEAIAQSWIDRLKSSGTAQIVLNQFLDAIAVFQQDQLEDWNGLMSLLKTVQEDISAQSDRKQRQGLEGRRNGIEDELDKIAKRRLHDQLVQASVLPIYGFPIDVVRLLTGESNKYKSSQGRHRLERDRRLALGEYAPGQEVVVDDRVYKSVGILRPGELEQRYYWVCQNCNNFHASNQQEAVEDCPVCRKQPSSAAAQKMKLYKIPKAFTTDWTVTPKVTPYTKPQRQPTSQVFLANDGQNLEELSNSGLYSLTVSQSGKFFLANQGLLGNGKGFSKQGFALCTRCGCDLSNQVQETRQTRGRSKSRTSKKASRSSQRPTHKHPITGKECQGNYELTHLGHEFLSDLLKIQFDRSTKPSPLFGEVIHYGDDRTVSSVAENPVNGLDFWRSLTYALLAAAARVIDVPRTELDGLFQPLADGRAEIIIYDNVPGGAGYSRRIAHCFPDVLQKAYELAASCSCDSSCYDCLRTYSNQPFHAQLNRHVVANYLQPLVEQVKPDPELQNFAVNANRLSLSQVAERLSPLCRMASSASIIYLPKLIDEFDLNNGSPLSWLNLLSDAVYAMQRSGMPLELIVNQLADKGTVSPPSQQNYLPVLQKRLQQWIDQGLLKLYESSYEAKALPVLCFSTQQPNRIALALHQRSDQETVEWFQTQSAEGVETVESRLQTLRSQARLVPASELADPDTVVVFPEPSWGELSLPQLRQKLGIDVILASQVKQVFYRDRYLNGQRAKFLAELLQGEGLSANSQVTILTLETSQSPSASELKAELEAALIGLKAIEIQPKVTVQPRHLRSDFPHARELEIQGHDQQKYKVIFDRGLDFLEKVENRETYRIKHSTYIAIIRQQ